MIAACPKCAARYRIDRERMKPEGVRLRCAKCEAVFRVRMPGPPAEPAEPAPSPVAQQSAAPPVAPDGAGAQAPASSSPPAEMSSSSVSEQAPEPPEPPSPVAADGPLILVAIPDAELGKQCEDSLKHLGFRASGVADGVEAMLEIQRQLPAVVVLAASLPRMYGFQICEIVKRNESLQHIKVVLVGSVHHKDRYRRPPGELYGADEFIEEPDLPGALGDVAQQLCGVAPGGAPQTESNWVPRPVAAPPTDEPGAAPGIEPASTREPALAPEPEAVSAAAPTVAEAPRPPSADDGLDDQRATAERLARIIVSDIVLYNEEKFQAAIAAGNVQQAMSGDLDEGRGLFVERIDERVREERDYLGDELLRVARARGMS